MIVEDQPSDTEGSRDQKDDESKDISLLGDQIAPHCRGDDRGDARHGGDHRLPGAGMKQLGIRNEELGIIEQILADLSDSKKKSVRISTAIPHSSFLIPHSIMPTSIQE